MEDYFDKISELLEKNGNVFWKYKDEAARAWSKYTIEEKRYIYSTIRKKINNGYFVSYLPHKAIDENAPRSSRHQVMSYDEYYKKYGTTEEVDGWKRVYKPEERTTVYYRH